MNHRGIEEATNKPKRKNEREIAGNDETRKKKILQVYAFCTHLGAGSINLHL